MPKVTAVAITHGNRWKFLSQMVESVMRDEHVTKLVVVDNGSQNKKEIEDGLIEYGERAVILRQEKNLGSAGGFAAGIAYAQKTDCDFVYLSDDDMVPEDGFVNKYLDVREFFRGKKVVISGYRVDVPGNSEVFYKQTIKSAESSNTFFNVFNGRGFMNYISLIIGLRTKNKRGPLVPIIPTKGFVYGGAFIPIEAVREAPLPDTSLFLYGDDIEYAWGIEKLGYASYASIIPVIHDIDITFAGSHITGLFEQSTAPFKVYYRIRNMVRLSIRHSHQPAIVLFFNVIFWFWGLMLIGLFKIGLNRNYLRRAKLILSAAYAGYNPQSLSGMKIEKSLFQ